MQRPAEHDFRRAAFDEAGGVHDVHPVRVARDDAEVVRDDDDGDAEPARQVFHQFENLRLNRHVESGRRLIGDQQLGIAGQANGDHHPLAHSAG